MKIFKSATFSTWIFTSSKLIILALLTYLIVSRFYEAEITLWYLFASIQGFGHLFEIGFSSTIIRYTSYANALSGQNETEKLNNSQDLYSSMNVIYLLLSGIVFIFLVIVGYLTVYPIINENPEIGQGNSYLIILLLFPINFFFKKNDAFIKGANKISLYNNWNASIYLFTGIITAIFIFLGASFFYIILINQIGILVNTVKNFFLTRKILDKVKMLNFSSTLERLRYYWGPTWKSAVISFSSNGANHLTGIIISSHFPVSISASFLFSLRMMNIVNEFSWAPFYSNLPLFIKKYKEGFDDIIIGKILKRINISLLLFIIGGTLLIILAPFILTLIDSNTNFITKELATAILGMIIIERLIAMHSQVIMFTNNINHYKFYLASALGYLIILYFSVNVFELFSIPYSYYCTFAVSAFIILRKSLNILDISLLTYIKKYLIFIIGAVILSIFILL